MKREDRRRQSNNPENANQNICTQRVCDALGVSSVVRYLHTVGDVKRAAGTKYSVRSVKSKAKGSTVGAIRKNLSKIGAKAYLIHVQGHVLLLSRDGLTIVDTDPRIRDKRKVLGVWGIYDKCSFIGSPIK